MSDLIEPENVPADQFSDYGSSIESETRSLASSLETYFEQNGRRYHTYFGPDKNPLPCDEAEQERLDIIHEACLLVQGGRLCEAPVMNNKAIQNVIDLGTGTGIWAIEFAQENPHSNVVGLDLTPMQPGWVPPNCRFEVDDFELEWTFKIKFDYVHTRMVSQCVSDWGKLLDHIYNNLNPGGWVELSEVDFVLKSDDNSIPPGYPAARTFDLIKQGVEQSGRLNLTPDVLVSLLQSAGFINIQVKTYRFPTNTWPKDSNLKQAGGLYTMATKNGYEAYLLAFGTRVLGMAESEVLELCRKSHECHLKRDGVHDWFPLCVAYAQKPEHN